MVNYCIGHSFPLSNDCTQNEEWSSTEISPATLKQKLKNVFLNAFSKFPVSRWSYPVLPSSSRVIRGSLALGCCCWSDSLYAFLFTEPTVLFFAVSDGVSGKTVFRLNAEEKKVNQKMFKLKYWTVWCYVFLLIWFLSSSVVHDLWRPNEKWAVKYGWNTITLDRTSRFPIATSGDQLVTRAAEKFFCNITPFYSKTSYSSH